MSGYGDLFDKPTITSVDGVADAADTQLLADETEVMANKLEEIVGNLHNAELENTGVRQNSIAAALGEIRNFSPEKPFNVSFGGYEQTFNDDEANEFTLDLIPDLGVEPVIVDPDTRTWNRVTTREDFSGEDDYAIVGKSLFFYKQPTGSFTITYTGDYPEDAGGLADGYKPNVYPAPQLITNEPTTKPTVTQLNPTRYKMEFTPSAKNNYLEEFGADLTLTFNSVLQTYVSAVSYIAAPLDFVSIWRKAEVGSRYRKLDCSAIYLRSATELEFESAETFDYVDDTLILVLSNITIADALHSIHTSLLEHTHDRSQNSQPILHSSLKNLIPADGKTIDGVKVLYGGSEIDGNDHSQYLHREGYKVGDIGTHSNSMLGDLVLSSTAHDGTSFLNAVGNSFKLVFGSPTTGAAMRLRYNSAVSPERTYVELDNSVDGLRLNTLVDNTADSGKVSFALSINNKHEIYTFRDGSSDFLTFGSISKKFKFANIDGDELGDVTLGVLSADSVTFNTGGTLVIDNVSMTKTDDVGKRGIEVSNVGAVANTQIKTPSDINVLLGKSELTDTVIVDGNVTNSLNIKVGGRVAFGDDLVAQDANNLTYGPIVGDPLQEDAINVSNEAPFRFFSTGRRTGFSFGAFARDEVATIYAAAPTGVQAGAGDGDLYIEANDQGAVYLLRTTNKSYTDSAGTHTFGVGADTNLQGWMRAALFAAEGTFTNLKVDVSNTTERKGLAFGTGGNSIYVTGANVGGGCPEGWMVLASRNGVVLVDASTDPGDCNNLNYSDLTAGDIQANGSIIALTDISAGESIRSAGALVGNTLEVVQDATINGALAVQGEVTLQSDITSFAGATFNDNVTVKGSLDIRNLTTLNTVEINGTSTFNELSRFEADLVVNGITTFNNTVSFNSEVNINDKLTVSSLTATSADILADLDVGGDIEVSGALDVGNAVTIGGAISGATTLHIAGAIIGDTTLTVANATITQNAIIAGTLGVTGAATFGGDLNATNADATVRLNGSTVCNILEAQSLEVNAEATLPTTTVTGPATFNSTLAITGAATFASNVEVAQELSTNRLKVVTSTVFEGNVTVEGQLDGSNAEFSGSVDVADDIFATNLQLTGLLTTPNANLGTTDITGVLTASGNAIFSGNFNVSGPATFTGTITATSIRVGSTTPIDIANGTISIGSPGSRGSLNVGNIVSEGDLSVSSITATGTTTFHGPVNLSSTGSFNGGGKRLQNVGAAVDNGDAVTLGQLNTAISENTLTQGVESINNAMIEVGGSSYTHNTGQAAGKVIAVVAVVYMSQSGSSERSLEVEWLDENDVVVRSKVKMAGNNILSQNDGGSGMPMMSTVYVPMMPGSTKAKFYGNQSSVQVQVIAQISV